MVNSQSHTIRVENVLRTLSLIALALIIIAFGIFLLLLLNVPVFHIDYTIMAKLSWVFYLLPLLSLILSVVVLTIKLLIRSPRKALAIITVIVSIAVFLLDVWVWLIPTYWNG